MALGGCHVVVAVPGDEVDCFRKFFVELLNCYFCVVRCRVWVPVGFDVQFRDVVWVCRVCSWWSEIFELLLLEEMDSEVPSESNYRCFEVLIWPRRFDAEFETESQ